MLEALEEVLKLGRVRIFQLSVLMTAVVGSQVVTALILQHEAAVVNVESKYG